MSDRELEPPDPSIMSLIIDLVVGLDEAVPFELREALQFCQQRAEDFAVNARERGIYRHMVDVIKRAML